MELGPKRAAVMSKEEGMDQQPSRPTWSRQIEFTLAGIGCAVGLGNVWRFPYLCYRSGGGVGMASVAISFIMCTYYNIVITWALYYLFNSFQSLLPWQSCNNTWNTPNCTDHATNSSYSSTASQEFFKYVVYFTALFPYVILIALLINNVQLPGASDGIDFFIVPEWDKLRSVEVWVNAAAQIFNSIGIGFGSLLAMSSYNSFNNNILKDTLFISITNSLTSILAGFVIFSAFGYMSHLQGIPVSQLAVDGPGLVFIVYPQAFASMPVSQLWAFLFFFMLLCLGLD
ncbi:hypothetical protein GOODEAATRI_004574, partial [Goodea atripinnis]